MKSLLRSFRAAFVALALVALFAQPVRAQNVIGNLAGGPGNVVAGADGYAHINTNFYGSYISGTAYTLTGSLAAVTGGTTSPSITLSAAGTYFIYADMDMNEVGATFAGGQTATFEFFRTNNTPGALTSSPAVYTFGAVTTVTQSAATMNVHALIYTTPNNNDVISVYGGLSATPSAGSVTVTGGGIYALRLY